MISRSRRGALPGAAILLSLIVAGCGGGSGGDVTPGPTPPASVLRATDSAGLTTYLRAALGPSSAQFVAPGDIVTVNTPAPAAAGSVAFSGTTLQEAGVDESDLVKTDGVSVFSLDRTGSGFARNTLRRQRFDAAAADAALSSVDSFALPFSADVRGDSLYLDTERQQVLALGRSGFGGSIYDIWFAPQPWAQGVTEVSFVDTTAALKAKHRLRIDAQLIGSRRIGATLYLVLRSYPRLAGFDPSWQPANATANRAVLDTLQAEQALPTVSIDGGAPQPLVAPSSCLVQDENASKTADIVTIAAIDLASGTPAARCFAGRTEAFYMSQRNLYLATTRTTYTAPVGGGMSIYPSQTSTDIHKFALDGGTIAYRGSGNVPGHLGFDQNRKSFRLGEDQEALRVVTQTQSAFVMPLPILVPVGSTGPTTSTTPTATTTASVESPARLSILKEQGGSLVTVGQLPNAQRPEPLGKAGEQLYASRFVGTRGYIVTYRLTDPLYVLDLSNPADPKVAGQLQVSGYSDYLFPLSETLLLGVGKDAVTDGTAGDENRFAWYQGVKVSLIDVSDPANPREAARQVIGRRGTSATVLSDHHGIAILGSATGARIALPVSVHETAPPQASGKPNDFYGYTRTELQRFQVNLAGAQLTQLPALAASTPTSGERFVGDDRAVLWNDQVHWYQDGLWRSGPW